MPYGYLQVMSYKPVLFMFKKIIHIVKWRACNGLLFFTLSMRSQQGRIYYILGLWKIPNFQTKTTEQKHLKPCYKVACTFCTIALVEMMVALIQKKKCYIHLVTCWNNNFVTMETKWFWDLSAVLWYLTCFPF